MTEEQKIKRKGSLFLIRMKDINLPITEENIAWKCVCIKAGEDYGLDLLEDELLKWDAEYFGENDPKILKRIEEYDKEMEKINQLLKN